jgi:uncharacterized delta-60 repeat protein
MVLFSLPSTIRRGLLQLGFIFLTVAGPALLGQTGTPSSADGFNPNVTGQVNVLLIQPNGQILVGGLFSQLQPNATTNPVVRGNLARVNIDGSLDPVFDPEPNGQILAMAIQSDGKILIGGAFTTVQPNGAASPTTRNHIARLNADGSLDTTFNPNATSAYVNSSQVYAIGVQSNGQIVIGGAFTSLQPNGAASSTTRNHIARLNSDGSLDTAFNPNANAMVAAIYVEPNGQILIGGGFTFLQPPGTASQTTRDYIARLNGDGSLDTGFNPGANNMVTAIAMQVDGKILIGGTFSLLLPPGASAATTADSIARINPNGSIDTSFTSQAESGVQTIALQADGKIVLGGLFASVQNETNTSALRYLCRLNPDGTIDGGFNPSPNYGVNAIAVQTDGKVVIGGSFNEVQPDGTAIGVFRNGIARLGYDGTLDGNFDPNTYGSVKVAAVQSTGQTIIGGTFSSVGGLTRNNLARLNANGSVDTAFDPEPNGQVNCLVIQPDGKILVGGTFSSFNPGGTTTAVTHSYLARLNADGSLDNTFDPEPNGEIDSMILQPGTSSTNFKILVGGGFAAFTPGSGPIPAQTINSTTTTTSSTVNGNTSVTVTTTTISNGTITVTTTSSTNTSGPTPVTTTTTVTATTYTDGTKPTTTTTTTVMTEVLYAGRLNPDGSVDSTFIPSPNNNITAMALEPADNAVLLVGNITAVTPISTNVTTQVSAIVRVSMTDASVDTSFNVNPGGAINAVAIQPNGQIVIAGAFSQVDPNPTVTTVQTTTGPVTTITAPTTRLGIARLNVDGSLDTNFNPAVAAPGSVYSLAINPTTSQILIGGIFSSVGGSPRSNIARLNTDGSVDTTFSAGLNGVVDSVQFLSNNQILATGAFTTVTQAGSLTQAQATHVVRFNSGGTLDTTFSPGVGANAQIDAIALQPDGKVLLGGNFVNIGGVNATNAVRLFSDTAFDSTLAANPDAQVNAIAVQPDGTIFLGGLFNGVGLTTNSSGTVVSTYSKYFVHLDGTTSMVDTTYSNLPNGPVNAIAVQQADGKVIIGGTFTSVGGVARNSLARYNTDGSVDTSFNPAIYDPVTNNVAGASVNSVIVQPADGKILIAGTFTSVGPTQNSYPPGTVIGGANHSFLARLNADGSVDAGFNPQVVSTLVNPYSFLPSALVLQPNGQVLLGGAWYNGVPTFRQGAIYRFNSDGTADSTFTSPTFPASVTASTTVNTLALAGDGTIIAGGSFGSVNGTAINNLVRFSSKGVLDTTFNPNPDGAVTALALQLDGKLYVAGNFDNIGGQVRNGLARLTASTTPIVQSIGISNDLQTIALARGGPGPEPVAVIFQSSLDDITWTTLGQGSYGAMTYAQAVAKTSLSGGGNEVWSYTIPTESPLPGSAQFYIRALAVVPTSENGSLGLAPITQALFQVPPPDFSSSTIVNAVSGALFYYQIAGAYNNGTTTYAATGLPPGLTLNATTGIISGTPTTPGTYSPVLTLTNASGSTTIPNAYVPAFTMVISGSAPTVATGPASRLINLSSRALVAAGSPLTAGLSIVGPSPKAVLLRAVGPGLAALNVTPFLDQPILQVYDKNQRVILTNQGWNGSASLMQTFTRLGAFSLAQGSADCAVLTVLDPGSYTVKVTSGDGTSGSVLLEAYDADPAPLDVLQRFFNLSGNGPVSAGNPLIAGFVVQGTTPKTLLIRGIGPTLANFGITTGILDPVLGLYNKAGSVIAQNEVWGTPATGSFNNYPVASGISIPTADTASYAFALPSGSADSVLLVTLPPGLYTAQVSSYAGASGTAMVEIYEVPGQSGD